MHIARNVLSKATNKLKRLLLMMFDPFSMLLPGKRRGFFATFKKKWQKDFPSAVKCLKKSIDACLTFFDCPEEEWICLRTTNIIERLNKKFKQRTKSMETIAAKMPVILPLPLFV